MEPSTLSDLDLEFHGITADDIIESRQAQRELIEDLRFSSKAESRLLFGQFREMEMLGRNMGYNYTYDENLQNEDDGGMC